MDDNLCNERIKTINENFKRQTEQIEKNSKKIGELVDYKSSSQVEIRNLVDRVKDLVETFESFMERFYKGVIVFFGSIIAVFVGFFIWYVQTI